MQHTNVTYLLCFNYARSTTIAQRVLSTKLKYHDIGTCMFFIQYNLSLFHIIICFSVTILQINKLSREIPYKNKTFIKYDNLYLHSVI